MPKRKFTRDELIEMKVANLPDEYGFTDEVEFMDESPVVDDSHGDMGDEEIRYRVFKAPDDGKLYRIEYECGGSKTGYSEMDPPNMRGSYTGYEVVLKEFVVHKYVRV